MDVVVYPGPLDASVAAVRKDLARADTGIGQNPGRVISQTWTGDSLLVVFDKPAAPARGDEVVDSRSVLRIALALLAAGALGLAGLQMFSLHSVGGNSVAELFDNSMGIFSFGLALMALAYAASTEGS